MKIGVIGMGWVGSSVAVSILHMGVATELLVNDRETRIAEGEAMDLAHGASFYPAAMVTHRKSSSVYSTVFPLGRMTSLNSFSVSIGIRVLWRTCLTNEMTRSFT